LRVPLPTFLSSRAERGDLGSAVLGGDCRVVRSRGSLAPRNDGRSVVSGEWFVAPLLAMTLAGRRRESAGFPPVRCEPRRGRGDLAVHTPCSPLDRGDTQPVGCEQIPSREGWLGSQSRDGVCEIAASFVRGAHSLLAMTGGRWSVCKSGSDPLSLSLSSLSCKLSRPSWRGRIFPARFFLCSRGCL